MSNGIACPSSTCAHPATGQQRSPTVLLTLLRGAAPLTCARHHTGCLSNQPASRYRIAAVPIGRDKCRPIKGFDVLGDHRFCAEWKIIAPSDVRRSMPRRERIHIFDISLRDPPGGGGGWLQPLVEHTVASAELTEPVGPPLVTYFISRPA